MSSTNLMVVVGRLGADAKPLNGSNGRSAFRFSVATEQIGHGGEKSTCWVPVAYWSGSEKEIEYLQSRLVKGAMVSVYGSMTSRRSTHAEFPVEITYWDLQADHVSVLSSAQLTSEPEARPGVAPSRVDDDLPELPTREAASAATGPKLQF